METKLNTKDILIKFENIQEKLINLMVELTTPILIKTAELQDERKLRIEIIKSLERSRQELLPVINGIKEGENEYNKFIGKTSLEKEPKENTSSFS
jgi:hypothetical protein